jgi:hypothetical protein
MIIKKLKLENYKGVANSEVEFNTKGITVVHGDNEIGKTSLAEAIKLLFDSKDDSKKSAIKEIKPINKDCGTKIEVEAQCGEYQFCYRKKYNKDRETVLSISHPAVENHTGVTAHDRALEILEEAIDTNLWKALNIQQGEGIGQAELSTATSLSEALDQVAGGRIDGDEENTVFDNVKTEFNEYFTATGRHGAEYQNTQNRPGELNETLEQIKTELQKVEEDVNRASEIGPELQNLDRQNRDIQAELNEVTGSLLNVDTINQQLSNLNNQKALAEAQITNAKENLQKRADLVNQITTRKQNHEELVKSQDEQNSKCVEAENNLREANNGLGEKSNEVAVAKQQCEQLAEDCGYYEKLNKKDEIKVLIETVNTSYQTISLAKVVLQDGEIDEEENQKIFEVYANFKTKEEILQQGVPKVHIEAINNAEINIGEEKLELSKQSVKDVDVAETVQITIPELLKINIKPGTSSAQLKLEADEAKQCYLDLCKQLGVDSVEQASERFRKCNEAHNTIRQENRVLEAHLSGRSLEETKLEFEELCTYLTNYPENRSNEIEFPNSLDEATTLKQGAETTKEQSVVTLNKLQEAKASADREHVRLKTEKETTTRDIKNSNDQLEQLSLDLVKERSSKPDDELNNSVQQKTNELNDLKGQIENINTELNQLNPQALQAKKTQLEGSIISQNRRIEDTNNENTALKERLRMAGENGLQNQLDEIETAHDRASRDASSTIRRANAAKLLFTMMNEERTKVIKAYAGPLTEKINELGKHVYGETFSVEFDVGALEVTGRVIDGVAIPFKSLSGGAKEQLSLITRLSCAMTVADNKGGVLIFDDTLGATDPKRLPLMGTVFSEAAKECQIIILTCMPERFSRVGNASVVKLRST